MKKIFLSLVLMVIFSLSAHAACDYSAYCSQKAYDVSPKGHQITSRVTGMTFLAEKIAQMVIKKELKKATKEKFKVELKAYSLRDLLGGKFQSLKISGRNLEIDGAYLSLFEAQTACDFNYVELNKNTLKFKENMVLDFAIEICDNDLRKTMQSSGYLNKLNKTNLSAFGITFFKLSGADVQIKNNKLYFTIKVTSPMSDKPIPVVISSDLKIEDGQIVVTKVHLVNLYTVVDLSRATALLNVLNPLTFSTDILNNKDSKTSIKSVDIIGNKIYIKGSVFIPKNSIKK